MPEIAFAGPILNGKEEEWRRFLQELTGPMIDEYEGLKRRLGVGKESVWLMRTPQGETAIVRLEAEEPDQVVRRLAASREPFDLWFKRTLLECHGCDLAGSSPPRSYSELIFAYPENGTP